MAWFSSRTISTTTVPVASSQIWDILTDPTALADLTPLVRSIEASGSQWLWTLNGFEALGIKLEAAFTETMHFTEGRQIVFTHDPPPGANDVIVAAVSEMGSLRVEAHRAELEKATTLLDLVRIARQLHEDDTTSDNMTVLAQAFAGAAGNDDMGPELYAALEPWSDMLAATIDRVLGDSPITQILPSREIADAMRALFLGIEMLDDLDSSRGHADAMFTSMESLAELLGSLLP